MGAKPRGGSREIRYALTPWAFSWGPEQPRYEKSSSCGVNGAVLSRLHEDGVHTALPLLLMLNVGVVHENGGAR